MRYGYIKICIIYSMEINVNYNTIRLSIINPKPIVFYINRSITTI